jgi:hypothetical protein
MRLRRLQWIDFEKQQFADGFRVLTDALGEPDNRPIDPIELARREGLIFVEMTYRLDLEPTRIAFVYSDYPLVKTFLSRVWFILLWRVVDQYTYGTSWMVEDKITGQAYLPPEDVDIATLLLHEIGIEPGTQLVIKLIKGEES